MLSRPAGVGYCRWLTGPRKHVFGHEHAFGAGHFPDCRLRPKARHGGKVLVAAWKRQVLELEHTERRMWATEVSSINQRLNEGGKEEPFRSWAPELN